MAARALDSTKHGSNLNDTVMLASWPTPCAQDGPNGGPSQGVDRLPGAVALASWPTPTVNDSKGSDYSYGSGDHSKICLKLPGVAKLTGWSTPLASDGDKTDCTLPKVEERAANGKQLSTAMQARLTSWPTPLAADAKRSDGVFPRGNLTLVGAANLSGWATPTATELGNTLENYLAMKSNMKSGPRKAITHLSLQAQLASWATPAARDYWSNEASLEFYEQRAADPRGKPLSEQVHQLTGSGPMPSGGTAETESTGQLNPELSRWLMGIPFSWTRCAPLRSVRGRRS